MASKKGKSKKMKIALIVIGCILLFFAIQTPITLAITSGKFAAGNKAQYSLEKTPALESSPLEGKTILFLGSSVTYGSSAGGSSFADYMAKRNNFTAIKEAVSGTVLVDEAVWGKESYITRMKTMDKTIKADAFICQLSTNDATMEKPLGTVSAGQALEDFDIHTVAGAIEYIIVYARQTWNCPVIFYTGTQFDSEYYGKMVDLLLEIQKKWDIGIIDLWNNETMQNISEADYKLYMFNGIHPTKAGYREWWTPVMEEYLYDFLGEGESK